MGGQLETTFSTSSVNCSTTYFKQSRSIQSARFFIDMATLQQAALIQLWDVTRSKCSYWDILCPTHQGYPGSSQLQSEVRDW